MLVIRLTRIGAKKQPTYRVVVTEARTPRDSREVERLGYYNPKTRVKQDQGRISICAQSLRMISGLFL
mgnify:CR=1 FL=1